MEKLNSNVVTKKTLTNPHRVLGRLFRDVPRGGRCDQYIVSCIYELLDMDYPQGKARPWAKIDSPAVNSPGSCKNEWLVLEGEMWITCHRFSKPTVENPFCCSGPLAYAVFVPAASLGF